MAESQHPAISPDSDAPRSITQRILARLLHFYFRLARGLTLGVRAMVLDEEGRVFLVRHTYVTGWHMPGGGVETGETLRAALARELEEEANIILESEPRLHGIFFNTSATKRDHVAVYIVTEFRQSAPRAPDREIAEAGFFPLAALPEGTTRATRQRLKEVMEDLPPAQMWSGG